MWWTAGEPVGSPSQGTPSKAPTATRLDGDNDPVGLHVELSDYFTWISLAQAIFGKK